jgi:hypothetical protein
MAMKYSRMTGRFVEVPTPAAGVPTTRNVNTTAPLTGGGSLASDLTLGVSDFVASGASHARGTVPDPGAVAGTTKFLREDATWQPISAAVGAAGTWHNYQWIGDNGSQYTSLAAVRGVLGIYIGGMGTGALTMNNGVMVAFPYLVTRASITFSNFYWQSTGTSSASKVRFGFYANDDASQVKYPKTLVADVNEWTYTGTAGVLTITQTVTLTGPALYWVAVNSNGATASGANGGQITTGLVVTTGNGGTITAENSLTVNQAYGAMPSTFPNGATGQNAALPLIAYRASAET